MLEQNKTFPNYPLAELHAHLGTSINPAIYWEIAQSLGFVLPRRDFHEFVKYVKISPENPMPLNEYFDKVYHSLLDKLSSGTLAVERGVYEIMSGAYRSNKITLIELRTNPMKHNNGAEVDLDQLIMAMLRGMEKALLAYPRLSAGLIFCIAREFSYDLNKIIIEKAVKYRRRGVVGIDVAGPYVESFKMMEYKELFDYAREAGLKITTHSGETRDGNDLWEAIEAAAPERVGHGIYAAYDEAMMKELAKRGTVLEVCPFSNLATRAVENEEEMRWIIRRLIEGGVKITINTDWPEVIERNHLHEQFEWLRMQEIMSETELEAANRLAFEASFVPGVGLGAYL